MPCKDSSSVFSLVFAVRREGSTGYLMHSPDPRCRTRVHPPSCGTQWLLLIPLQGFPWWESHLWSRRYPSPGNPSLGNPHTKTTCRDREALAPCPTHESTLSSPLGRLMSLLHLQWQSPSSYSASLPSSITTQQLLILRPCPMHSQHTNLKVCFPRNLARDDPQASPCPLPAPSLDLMNACYHEQRRGRE